ncbi:RNA-binding protein 26 [Cladorrhinum sp. PSN259]|nr:RNA-binding protein 26 [Cladorrhinum sp. PSN259]
MLFPDEDSPELKKWIVKRLENTSDADTDVLADYVMALLNHDGDVSTVRGVLEIEVPGFLKEGKDSAVFIDDVFEAIKYRSYLPNAPPRPPKSQSQSQQQKLHQKYQQQLQLMEQLQQQQTNGGAAAQQGQQQQQQAYGISYDDGPMMSQQQGRGYALAPQSQPFSNGVGSRKRGYQDLDNPYPQQQIGGGYGGNNGRSSKQARRGARDPPSSLREPSAAGGVDYLDPQATMKLWQSMAQLNQQMNQRLGLPPPPPPDFSMLNNFNPGKGKGGKRKARCRDYEKKGYCPRGINCNFEHNTDDFQPPPPQAWNQPDEYDPSNALMTGMLPGGGTYQPSSFQPTPDYMFEGNGFDTSNAPSRQSKNQKNGGRSHPRYTKRAPFSAEGASFDRSNTTIVVEQIPEENFEESQVREFFSQFGNILEVSMKPYKRLAIVKYEAWEEAEAAYQSPKVIFENRFVRVYWYKEPSDEAPNKKPTKNGFAKQDDQEDGEVLPESEPIDMDELIKKQVEAQKIYEEKQKKLEEIEKERLGVERKQMELLEKAAKAKAELAAKMARKKGGISGDKKENGGELTQTEILRAQLAILEDEARGLGLDPDAAQEDDGSSFYSPSTYDYSARGGGYRGRGRGRGRGVFAPRGRGGYHRGGGYAGDVHAAYAAYSLDNRPKKVVVTGVDLTGGGRDEMLRQYLFGIGEFTDIQSTSNSTEIAFKDRKTAEKFHNSVAHNGGVIPGIEGQVELAWASGSGGGSSSVATPRTSTPAAAFKKEDDDQEEGEIDEDYHDHDDKDVRITLDRPTQGQNQNQSRGGGVQQDLDYEVADDDEGGWGY